MSDNIATIRNDLKEPTEYVKYENAMVKNDLI